MTRRRCLIYTRKSTEEGLEQGFNSLQAQREACEAYIKSQAHEGWRLIPRHFDDGGYSGGSMERPALQRLLADINAGLVDTIVVYKVDRLTRSLADFAKMVETFDAKGVSFVSVTQQFNTTTSMGRLTLNVLLSFAQFEREVTAERIRDKIAASKRKGMWMGGTVPLGYEAKNRELVIVQDEAKTVRQLFELYVKLDTVMKVKAEADRLGLVAKQRRNGAAQITGGGPFSRGHLHWILSNPLYAGRIGHKGVVHPGRHPAIIDPETFDTIQRRLADNATQRRSDKNAKEPSLLAGLVFDETGDRLCPTHTSKKGRRYRYYISKRLMHDGSAASNGWRLPAKELEAIVLRVVQQLLRDKTLLVSALGLGNARPDLLKEVLAKACSMAVALRDKAKTSQQLLLNLLQRIQLHPDSIHFEIRRSALTALGMDEVADATAHAGDTFEYVVPIQLARRGVEAKMVVPSGDSQSLLVDESLVALLADAHHWIDILTQGRATSLRDLARRYGKDFSEVSRALPLAFLAPKIVGAVLEGRQPKHLVVHQLKRATLPRGWADQQRSLGFP